MSTWIGVEVKSGEPCSVKKGEGKILHLSQVIVEQHENITLIIYLLEFITAGWILLIYMVWNIGL